METAQKKWLRLRGYNLLTDVIAGVKFVNGIKQTEDQNRTLLESLYTRFDYSSYIISVEIP